MKTLVLFDFDGTITKKDTLITFIKYYKGSIKCYWGLILMSPVILLQKMNLLSSHRAKEIVISWFFRGQDADLFKQKCLEFSLDEVPKQVRKDSLSAIDHYKGKGYEICIVSASVEDWITPWATKYGINCIATKIDFHGQRVTGKILGKNCNGNEKVARVKSVYDLTSFDSIIVFGDSKGDEPMLALGTESYYRPFRK